MAEFTTPEFLQNHSPDQVFDKMVAILPPDIDLSEGGHAWNLLRPTALSVAELYEFCLPEIVRLIFPEYSYGEFLDAHAKTRGMTRRTASAASGELTITGDAGTVIQVGNIFSTAAINDEPSVDYKVLRSVKIPASGTVKVEVECTQNGTIGNAAADTIVFVSSKISGITAVTNEIALTGGSDTESDESLIGRITEYDQSLDNSYTGCVADYKRWATSVPGVGGATIIPANDDTGLVTVILTDANGAPATKQLCTTVYNYIMQPDHPEERLAPINAYLSVQPPATMAISIKATVELVEGATIEGVKAAYVAKLASYLPKAMSDGEIKYTRIAATLSAVDDANDFSDLQIGVKDGDSVTYGTSNIAITSSQLPTVAIEDLVLTSGTV